MSPAAHLPPFVKTKTVATVGPASESAERLSALIEAGVDIFRLNMAHGRHDWHESVLRRIRQVSAKLERPIAVLADLGGPKIRLGPIAGGGLTCEPGQQFRFLREPHASHGPYDLTSTYQRLVDELKVGDLVLLADGTVSGRSSGACSAAATVWC